MFKNLISRFKSELCGRIITTVLGALLTIILARVLGADSYGLLFLTLSILGTLKTVSKLGIAKSAARYIADYKEKDPSQIPHIIRFSFIVNLATIFIVSLFLAITHENLAEILGEPELAPLLLAGTGYVIFGTLLTFVYLVLQGFEKIQYSARIRVLNSSTRFLFVVGFILLGYGAFEALLGYILAFFVSSIIGLLIIYSTFYRKYRYGNDIETDLRKRVIEYSIPLTASYTANTIDKRIDIILLGLFLNPVAVSFYTISKQIVTFIETPVSALGFTLSPTYASKKASDEIGQASKLYETALKYTMIFYIPAAVGLVVISEPMIEYTFGSEYVGAVPVIQILSLFIIMQAVMNNTSKALDYLGRARMRAIIQFITSLLNVVLNVILIPMIGLIGAPIATIISYGIYTIFNIYVIHTEFDLRVTYLLRAISHTTVISLVMSYPIFILLNYITGLIALLSSIILGLLIWGALAVMTGLVEVNDFRSGIVNIIYN